MWGNNLKFLCVIGGGILCVLLFAASAHCQERGSSQYGDQFPDAPEPVKQDAAGNLMHDKSADPPKWYEHTFTKKWDASVGALVGSNVLDIELTQRCQAKGTCVESGGRESRGEMYRNDMIADGAIIGLSLLFQSQHFPKKMGWIAYVPLMIGTGRHVNGIVQGARYF